MEKNRQEECLLAPPLGELSPKVTERARMLTEKSRRSDSIALPKRQFIAAWRLSGDGLALPVIACAMPPLPKGEAFASRKACPLCPRLSLWESWRGAPERARTLTERNRRSDSIALPKSLLIAAWRLSGDRLALSVSLRSPAPPKGEPLAGRVTSYWTPEPRYGAKGRALLQGAAASGQAHLVKLP